MGRVWQVDYTDQTGDKTLFFNGAGPAEIVTAWKAYTGEPVDLAITNIKLVPNATIA